MVKPVKIPTYGASQTDFTYICFIPRRALDVHSNIFICTVEMIGPTLDLDIIDLFRNYERNSIYDTNLWFAYFLR